MTMELLIMPDGRWCSRLRGVLHSGTRETVDRLDFAGVDDVAISVVTTSDAGSSCKNSVVSVSTAKRLLGVAQMELEVAP